MAIVVNSNSNSNDIEKQDTNILTKKLVNNINSYLFDRIEQLKLYDNSYNLTVKKRGAGYILCYNLIVESWYRLIKVLYWFFYIVNNQSLL